MRIFHLLTDRTYPFHRGGLEASVYRIASIISEIEACKVIIYYTEKPELQFMEEKSGEIRFISLNEQLDEVKKPLEGYKRDNADNRVTYLILKNHINEYLGLGENILLSFYLTVKGFVMQRIADDLHIPHIALVRGSDYSADSFNYFRLSAMRYVCENATRIVTTNNEQHKGLINMFGLNEQKIYVCHNSVNAKVPLIKPGRREKHYFFTDVGYSFKKGTHLLLDAFEQIVIKGGHNPFVLHICGETTESEKEYWEQRLRLLQHKYKKHFIFDSYLKDVTAIFDICSCYIFPSLAEGCSSALSKALMSGLPVITTRTGIVDELPEEMKKGVEVINPGNISPIKKSVESILNTEETVCYEARAKSVYQYLSRENEKKKWTEIINLDS